LDNNNNYSLSHFDEAGNAAMVDVGTKGATRRRAVANGQIQMGEEAYNAAKTGSSKKGDVLGVARIAGIMAAKKTSELIPLCHIVPIEHIYIDFEFEDSKNMVIATCVVATTAKTGVEMEALTGVSVCLLTVYDMLKSIDKGMSINKVGLLEKTGGKSGDYKNTGENL